jgi:hypothetical protein
MKFSLKTLAAAVVTAVAASGANAAIDNGTSGNGELFFNIWNSTGSYTFDLNTTITGFESSVAAAGNINQSYALSNLGTFLAGITDTSSLKFNLVATDVLGARRLLTTYTVFNTPATTNDSMRTVAQNVNGFATSVNAVIGSANNVAVSNGSPAWAGKAQFHDNPSDIMGFSNGGTLANNSFANGLNFMRADIAASGVAQSVYNPYMDGGNSVKVWVDGTNNLHIQAMPVPEPESYAMLLAGLGMLGFMARRRLNNRG